MFGVTIPSRARARPATDARRCDDAARPLRDGDLVECHEPGGVGEALEGGVVEHDVDGHAADGLRADDDLDRSLRRPRRFLRAGMPGKELRVGMSRVEPRERGPVVRAQRVLHRPRACEPQRLDLTLLDDAAVLADRCTQRAGQSRVGAGALVIGRVAPERPGGRDQRQDEQD